MWIITILFNIYNALVIYLIRMTTVAWIFAAIIIGQGYIASLTSMLTIRRLKPQVTDYEALKNANAVVGYNKGSHVAQVFGRCLGFQE
ncbi:putative ionotropic glutamate receptor [Helianthus anomalus]